MMGLVCALLKCILREKNLVQRKALTSLRWRLLMSEIQSTFEAARTLGSEDLLHRAIDLVAPKVMSGELTACNFSGIFVSLSSLLPLAEYELLQQLLVQGKRMREAQRLTAHLLPNA